MEAGAIFDETHAYRYLLWRRWQASGSTVAFILLNPSTADAQHNDPTIRRCLQFAIDWGFGSMEVVNLFAYRTPHPSHLKAARQPVGPETDRYLLQSVTKASQIIVGWGNWGTLLDRDQTVLALLQSMPLCCLGTNRSGQPRHPLYTKRDLQPTHYPYRTNNQ